MPAPKGPQRITRVSPEPINPSAPEGHVYVSGFDADGNPFDDMTTETMRNTWLRKVAAFVGVPASNDPAAMRAAIRAKVIGNHETTESHRDDSKSGDADSVPTTDDPPTATANAAGSLADAIADAIAAAAAGAMDADAVRALVDQRVAEIVERPQVTRIIVRDSDGNDSESGEHKFRPHPALQDTLDILSVGLNPYLMGPAGSGKTTCAAQVADALDLPFFTLSGAPTPQDADLRGYQNIQGVFMAPDFHVWATEGGVFLMDEFDAMYPGSQVWLNSATANRFASFPNGQGVVPFHENALLVAAGNTNLGGATGTYSARNRADGATLDRFETLRVDYDTDLEDAMARATGYDGWRDVVASMRKYRRNAEAANIPIPITPRRTVSVCKFLQLGWPAGKAWNVALWDRMDADTRVRVEGA